VSNVVDLRRLAHSAAVPTLVLVDLQQEYSAVPRAFALTQIDDALANCRELLAHARSLGIPVAFTRLVGQSPFFNPATRFSHWISGFEPTKSDMIFDRGQPSCYSSEDFAEIIASSGGNLVIAGFAGESACLSTAIDAFHRGHRLVYIADASASHPLDDISAGDVHNVITRLVGLYGDVITTRSWISNTPHQPASKRVFS
jgi:nicotinamidase-related amidase